MLVTYVARTFQVADIWENLPRTSFITNSLFLYLPILITNCIQILKYYILFHSPLQFTFRLLSIHLKANPIKLNRKHAFPGNRRPPNFFAEKPQQNGRNKVSCLKSSPNVLIVLKKLIKRRVAKGP